MYLCLYLIGKNIFSVSDSCYKDIYDSINELLVKFANNINIEANVLFSAAKDDIVKKCQARYDVQMQERI